MTTIHQAPEGVEQLRPIQVMAVGNLAHVPVPLVRVTCCGLLTLETVTEMVSTDPPLARYVPLSSEQLRGRGVAPALQLLKMLLSRPHRFALKDWLLEQFCHDRDLFTSARLENIVWQLRSLLCPPAYEELRAHLVTLVRGSTSSGNGYQLASYPLIWADVDALTWNVEQAARMERFGDDPLPYWERAYALAKRGIFLPDELYSDWATARRGEVTGILRQSVQALARLYLARYGQVGEEEALLLLRSCWQEHPQEEDVLRPLMELLGKRERYQEALEYYERLKSLLEADDCQPDPRTQDVAEYLHTLQLRRTPHTRETAGNPVSPDLISSHFPLLEKTGTSPFSRAITQTIIEEAHTPERGMMDQLRRQILKQALRGTGIAIFAPHDFALDSEIASRLTRALVKSSWIDEKTLLYLEKRIENYWRDRNEVSFPVWHLLPYVLEDLQKITSLLEGSLRPSMRTRLCSIAGTAAMLIGELYYDLRNYVHARVFQEVAITAAHEANNTLLEAVAWGRNSFTWTYEGNPSKARDSIQQARYLAESKNTTLRAWLAAVEAEIRSHLGDRQACLKALKDAESLEIRNVPEADCYWIYFDQSLLAGYQGVSFLKLSHLGHKDLVQNAQIALQNALDLLDPSMKRRQPTLLVDLAGVYVQQKNIDQACEYAMSAIDIAAHIGSKVLLQRLLSLRNDLEPWEETCYVQDLDRAIGPLLLPEKHQDEETMS